MAPRRAHGSLSILARLLLCTGNMYPLLAAAGSAVASNLLESVGSLVQRKLAQGQAPEKAQGQAGAAPVALAHVPTLQEQIAKMKMLLLNAPELQTMVNSSGATAANSLSLSAGGIVSYTAQDGRPSALTLSPETANLARDLGSLFSQANGAATTGAFSLTTPARVSLSVYA